MHPTCMYVLVMCAMFPLVLSQATAEMSWAEYKEEYDKSYATRGEDSNRSAIYYDNVRKIAAHNRLYDFGYKTFRQEMNNMGDLTLDEFAAKYLGRVKGTYAPRPGGDYVHWSKLIPRNKFMRNKFYNYAADTDDNIDMRQTGCTTNAKKQNPCGQCVTFAEMARLEYLYCMKGCGKKMFSEKEALDCDSSTTCADGSMTGSTYAYVDNKGGISAEQDYPWPDDVNNEAEMDGHSCQKHPKYPIKMQKEVRFEKAHGETDYERDMWRAMKALKARFGPIVVVLELSLQDVRDLQHLAPYGIVSNDQGCLYTGSTKALTNHAVAIFGMGTELDNMGTKRDYWLVKNSWGAGWNKKMRGYFKILRNDNTYCIGENPQPAPFIDCKYNCRKRNPCTYRNRRNGLYYFPSSKGKRHYVQCGISKRTCKRRKCPKKGTIWNARANGCAQKWWERLNKKKKQKNKKNKKKNAG